MADTKFKKGVSGNPKGRPKGSTSHDALRQAIADNATDIINALIEQAKSGDMQAAKIVLDRILPPLKATAPSIQLERMLGGSLSDKGQAVIDAVARGDIAPDNATAIMSMLSTQAKIIEASELLTRIEALEAQANEKAT